ncbi:hypothetical protein METBIDRAFT_78357 [Metschnikowia bicuspidata var. bicuspidata NRRL YB-4993]|uniref:Amino acid transporter n=1 Tax=Metschnikowia bicuspidata var. bicuspidata NRRL YB-4993 TaxID=869754 RepID=A0A1A0HBW2_9ASCO|nr:hypothetical protein METBIDRAFT_78357 [Metschnikowia bicuspidata var. bicuspidata NRRL YB-4993]OBA21378.1 hypothetical protein METBIDRAFT_78357 [Metschnikowia bicuspidata var. bicuspidata NRRL YB-4993]
MDDDEVEHVEHFRYKQDLQRKLTVTSVVGLGFTLMGVPFGLSSTLWISLVDGGSVTILYGWLVVGFFSLCVVLSLSEIIAKFPTAGGVYHFSAILSHEKYSLISSWFTGWFLLIGNWTYAVSILFSGSQFILSIFGLKDVYYKQDMLFVLGVYFIMLTLVGFINYKFSRHLERINKLCIFWSIGTVIVIGILLLIFAKKTNSASHILTHFDNSRSGWPDPLAFMVGMQSSCFTLTGYGMLFSMTDEVKRPEKNMPKGAVSAVSMAVLQGLFFIVPVLIILPSLTVLLDSNPEIMPIDLVFKTATQSYVVSFLLIVLLIGTVMFQAIGALTTASRSTYVFARDGGLPFKEIWTQVDSVEEYTLPKNALFLSMAVIAVFSFLALISPSAFNAFMGASVVSLALANGIPILCLMLNKRKKIKGSAFRLKYFGWIINALSVAWVFLSFFILCLPPVIKDISWRNMNYASVVLVILAIIALIGYKTWGANVFTGPLLDTDYLELHNMEAQARKHDDSMSQKPGALDPETAHEDTDGLGEQVQNTVQIKTGLEETSEKHAAASSSMPDKLTPEDVDEILASGNLEDNDQFEGSDEEYDRISDRNNNSSSTRSSTVSLDKVNRIIFDATSENK